MRQQDVRGGIHLSFHLDFGKTYTYARLGLGIRAPPLLWARHMGQEQAQEHRDDGSKKKRSKGSVYSHIYPHFGLLPCAFRIPSSAQVSVRQAGPLHVVVRKGNIQPGHRSQPIEAAQAPTRLYLWTSNPQNGQSTPCLLGRVGPNPLTLLRCVLSSRTSAKGRRTTKPTTTLRALPPRLGCLLVGCSRVTG